MTQMIHRMRAFVRSPAFVFAFGSFGSTRHGWVNDNSAALAMELVEGNPRARQTVADVARKLTAMFFALQTSAALLSAGVFQLNAAILVAFVLST